MGSKRLPPIVVPEDPATLGYLAGLIDGEGTIGIKTQFARGSSKNPSHSIVVSVVNTDARLMLWLGEVVGGRVYGPRADKRNTARGHKPRWDWTIFGGNAERLLIAIRPYLVIKGEQADLAIGMRRLGRTQGRELGRDLVARREQLKQQMHVLNQRGLRVAS